MLRHHLFRSSFGILLSIGLLSHASNATAAVCDYRPSQQLAKNAETIGANETNIVVQEDEVKHATAAISAAGAGGAAVAATGIGIKAAGFYTLTHSVTGLTMVGSTVAGTSGAGTVGIIAGTGGAVGTAVAFVTAPATILAAAAITAVVGGYEGACFFTDERVTDRDVIMSRVKNLAENASPELFRYDDPTRDGRFARIFVMGEDGLFAAYDVTDLYIVNGVLKNRDWFLNTTIGRMGFNVVK